MPVTKNIFCASEQKETPHTFVVITNFDKHKELISKCTICGRELKWPADATADKLLALFAAHKEANEGHVFAAEGGGEVHPVLDVLANL